jgi:hypothetical protein
MEAVWVCLIFCGSCAGFFVYTFFSQRKAVLEKDAQLAGDVYNIVLQCPSNVSGCLCLQRDSAQEACLAGVISHVLLRSGYHLICNFTRVEPAEHYFLVSLTQSMYRQ